MIKILFTQHAGLGGSVVSLSQIINSLDRKTYEVIVLLLRNDVAAVDLLQKSGAKVIVDEGLSQIRYVQGGWSQWYNPFHIYYGLINLFRLGSARKRFKRYLIELKPQVVYLNSLCVLIYARIAYDLKIPVILHIREVILNGLFRLPRKWHQIEISKFVTMSLYIGEYEKQLLAKASTCEVVPNYVDLTEWHKTKDNSQNEIPVILFVGGTNKIKGLLTLLKSLSILNKWRVKFHCIILGVDVSSATSKSNISKTVRSFMRTSTEYALRYVHEKGLTNNVTFKPFEKKPIGSFQQADILVFPATVPHFPRPIVEAGAMAIPSVASDIPGPRDIVINGETGFLVHPRVPMEFAEALRTLIENPVMRLQMGCAAQKRTENKHNAANNQARIIKHIERLVYP